MGTKQTGVRIHGIACDGLFGFAVCKDVSCACWCHGGVSRWERESRANVAAIKRHQRETRGY
jgi:hypothetical protein